MEQIKLDKLLEIIKEVDMNYDEFANEIGVTKSFLTKVISGERNPSYNFIKKIKERFPEVDTNDFFP